MRKLKWKSLGHTGRCEIFMVDGIEVSDSPNFEIKEQRFCVYLYPNDRPKMVATEEQVETLINNARKLPTLGEVK